MSNKKLKVLERSISQTQNLGRNVRSHTETILGNMTKKSNLNINQIKKASPVFEQTANKYEKSLKKTKVLESNVKRTVNKKMGLKTPTSKTASKVVARSFKGMTSNYKPFSPHTISQGSKSPEAHFRNLKSFQRKFPEANAKKLKKDMRSLNRMLKGVEIAGKIGDKAVKTMGVVKKLTPLALVGAIMSPKPAGQGSDLGKPIPKRYR